MSTDSEPTSSTMQEEAKHLHSSNPTLRLNATRFFRKLVSNAENSSSIFDRIIEQGVVPIFVEFLQNEKEHELQFESAWILTCFASGTSEHTQLVIQLGAVPIFIKLLIMNRNDDIQEQAISALGNIAGDGAKPRDLILREGALAPLLKIIAENPPGLSILRNVTWALSNICRPKPLTNFELISPAIPTLAHFLYHRDETVLMNACWALAYLCDGAGVEQIDQVIKACVVRRLVELMYQFIVSPKILSPALRAIGNIVTGNDDHVQVVLNCNPLFPLGKLILNATPKIRREACWTISNILAGNEKQIQEVIDANIIPSLIRNIETTQNDIKKESIWGILNAIIGGNNDQIMYIIEIGSNCVGLFCDIILNDKQKMKHDALKALSNIVRACRAKETGDCYEEMIKQKGLWHEVMYNQFRGATGHVKKFVDNLTNPNTSQLYDAVISFKDEMEDG
ncbi:hypothetical protein FDP41_013478 [Naegleria fowleri]|uniref:Importin subunit alpha n=1 Tax=Naegleria fowleri TaxID=5763 RepID=A0A6A5C105_NAEFO|nr:uncharacterized protein FDP41_013478 [Naegleria fowleri]KAF0980264.1 hypothetical protein FDP41_013478 [Naegleria fowleri]CAG4717414.1 unnamed protein product [Naegleria fowleri]